MTRDKMAPVTLSHFLWFSLFNSVFTNSRKRVNMRANARSLKLPVVRPGQRSAREYKNLSVEVSRKKRTNYICARELAVGCSLALLPSQPPVQLRHLAVGASLSPFAREMKESLHFRAPDNEGLGTQWARFLRPAALYTDKHTRTHSCKHILARVRVSCRKKSQVPPAQGLRLDRFSCVRELVRVWILARLRGSPRRTRAIITPDWLIIAY